ncbi:hypothetical protein [Mycoplasmopsis cynos]|uniref:hypothetical protein n=1 Tax=Mycoplasmopsis cynos TaxID=171284 RepID=UPI00220B1833|nr:hypothetical protein [Mycoplasmopsis cynos]UWV82264.1 hypothetical protein NW067_04520 [Mycoplasmopsis cynos]
MNLNKEKKCETYLKKFEDLYLKIRLLLLYLTILVFLTSGVFTVLRDTAKAMKKQYDRYKDVSRPHDLTVDLNLPISGSAYNNGYFINGLSKEGAQFKC